jgi:hypothetical protein
VNGSIFRSFATLLMMSARTHDHRDLLLPRLDEHDLEVVPLPFVGVVRHVRAQKRRPRVGRPRIGSEKVDIPFDAFVEGPFLDDVVAQISRRDQ